MHRCTANQKLFDFQTALYGLADLLSKLSGERSRWAQQLAALDGQLAELPLAALAAAAFITYLPAHPEDVRERVMQGWTRCGISSA
jgi:dynein heavy chain 2